MMERDKRMLIFDRDQLPTMFEAHVLHVMYKSGCQSPRSIAKKIMPREIKRKHFGTYVEEAVFLVEEAQMRLAEKGFLEWVQKDPPGRSE